jgi:hypothetical protein
MPGSRQTGKMRLRFAWRLAPRYVLRFWRRVMKLMMKLIEIALLEGGGGGYVLAEEFIQPT